MESLMKEFKHLAINLEDIKSATDNFNNNRVIGRGGFGNKGELSRSKGKTKVAFKRLDSRFGQGGSEFVKEIRMLSCYTHENLISLLGICSQGDEMILMYEFAARGSLDHYLSNVTLTWTQRLKICLDAAKGLSYLHDPKKTYQRLIHCDIKSANILLDENFNAKVADFGLSKIGPANSILVTEASGTPGYCDPVYMETYTLTKESDVYSFGVVLFEVLCGKLCIEYSNGRIKVIHVPVWKQSYERKQLSRIVFQGMMQQMDPDSLQTFADIAYKCLKKVRKQRPTMSLVVEKLQESLALQELHDLKKPKEYEDIVNAAVPPLKYRSLDELKVLLTKGFHVNKEKTRWLSITEKGEHIEKVYIEACLNPDAIEATGGLSNDILNSRFPGGLCYSYCNKFKAHVRGEYLTPHISYTVNIVFRYYLEGALNEYHPVKYKIDGGNETKALMIYPYQFTSRNTREDGWFIAPLYQFTSQNTTTDLQFEFERPYPALRVAGIEFQPFEEKEELQVFEEYQHILEAASQSLVYKSLQELRQILSIGIHLKDYKTWFSINEKGEHCHMISMKECLIPNEDFPSQHQSHYHSRFPAGFYYTKEKGFKTHVTTRLLNTLIPYTVNLIFYRYVSRDSYIDLKYRIKGETKTSTVNIAKKRGLHFLMAELYQVTSNEGLVDLEIDFDDHEWNLPVEGILFQPLEKVEDQVLEDDKVEDIQTILDSDSDTYWGQKLPNDYEEILKLSKHSVEGKTKKELYSILCQGFLIKNGRQWFTVDKNGKKCQMLSARATCVIDGVNSTWESSNESRFGEVLVIADYQFEIDIDFKIQVSPKTTYAVYLVYKLPKDQSTFEAPLGVWRESTYPDRPGSYIYLVSPPHTPVIGPKFDENTYNPLNRYKGYGIPQQRTDGWMEVKVWEFHIWTTTKRDPMRFYFMHPNEKNLKGLMVQGIELRPE